MMSANIVSKYIDGIRSKYESNNIAYIDDLILLYKELMDKLSESLKMVDNYYLKISEFRTLELTNGYLASLSDYDFNEMFRLSKIKVLENIMKQQPEIQEHANYINETLKNDKLARKIGLKFDDSVATAENTMNNYILLKNKKRLLEERNTHERK